MARTPVERYVWLIDVLRQRGRLTRAEINRLWRLSPYNDEGRPLSRKTLYNYKKAIGNLFDVVIECDTATFEYYIEEDEKSGSRFTDWLLNSTAVNEALSESRDISDRVLLEDVPSARQHLPLVLKALKASTRLKFDYHNYTRSRPTPGVVLEPYLTRIFRQRWYVLGRNLADNRLKTYALDRMSNVTDTGIGFNVPEDFDTETYFRYSYGIVVNRSEPRDIVLRTDHHYAKYIAALPLHHTQEQSLHDNYCLFTYRMQITDDLVQELLSHGSRIVVEQPRELRVRMREELRKSLDAYDNPPVFSAVQKRPGTLPVTDLETVRTTISENPTSSSDKK